MTKSKLSAFLSLILVFASGAVLGAFAYRLYSAPPVQVTGGTPAAPPRRMTPAEYRQKYTVDLTKAAKLDPDQVKKVTAILDEITGEYDKLHAQSKPEWDALEEQRQALDKKWRPAREAIQNHQTEAINAILREDQRPLFEAWRAERERQRKLRDQQHKKQ
jgi:hypothetical protein